MLAASLSYKVFENAVKCAITKVEIGEISSLTEPLSRSLFNFLCGNDTFVSLPTGHGKYLIRPTSFPGFSPTRPYGARERETLVGSGHVVPEQN